jgi:hypothetical protein
MILLAQVFVLDGKKVLPESETPVFWILKNVLGVHEKRAITSISKGPLLTVIPGEEGRRNGGVLAEGPGGVIVPLRVGGGQHRTSSLHNPFTLTHAKQIGTL